MSNIFRKIGEWVTPQKKHCYLFNEGSWDDRQLLGILFYSFIVTYLRINTSIEQATKVLIYVN